MAEPKFSVSEVTTFHLTTSEDLATYRKAGVEGIGVWEFKLPEGDDAMRLPEAEGLGVEGDDLYPATLSIWPVPFPGPTTRGSGRRSSATHPPVRAVRAGGDPLPHGPSGGGADPDEARRVVVDGLRQAAKVVGRARAHARPRASCTGRSTGTGR